MLVKYFYLISIYFLVYLIYDFKNLSINIEQIKSAYEDYLTCIKCEMENCGNNAELFYNEETSAKARCQNHIDLKQKLWKPV